MKVGFAAAAVLGLLDFLDQAQGEAGRWVATRARIIFELEGFVGQRKIDDALRLLEELGWVRATTLSEARERNFVHTKHYALDSERVSDWLEGGMVLQAPKLQNCKPRACNSASKNASSVYTEKIVKKAEEESAPATDFFNKVTSETHPGAAVALAKLAKINHLARPSSNEHQSLQNCRKFLALAGPGGVNDDELTALVQLVSDRGGWLSEVELELKTKVSEKKQSYIKPLLKVESAANDAEFELRKKIIGKKIRCGDGAIVTVGAGLTKIGIKKHSLGAVVEGIKIGDFIVLEG